MMLSIRVFIIFQFDLDLEMHINSKARVKFGDGKDESSNMSSKIKRLTRMQLIFLLNKNIISSKFD